MANVLLTSKCNRACPFCFAAEEVTLAANKGAPPRADWAMSLETVEKIIQLHKRSKLRHMAMLGGEPTIHPQFNRVVERALEEGLCIKLFTGGLIPPKVKEFLKTIDPGRLSIIANISGPGGCRSQGEYEATIATVRELAKHTSLSFTITRPDFDARFQVDLIAETGCRRHIRLGLELPMLSDPSPRLDPSLYRETAKTIMKLARYGNDHDVSLGFDCGFVMCMFEPEELGLLRVWNCQADFLCNPIIDISPDLQVWACFATSPLHRVTVGEQTTRQELDRHFREKQKPYRTFGVFDECETCLYKARGQCGGGCLSFVIRNFNGSGFESLKGRGVGQSRHAPTRVPKAAPGMRIPAMAPREMAHV